MKYSLFSRVEPPMCDDIPVNERDSDSPSGDMLEDYDRMSEYRS